MPRSGQRKKARLTRPVAASPGDIPSSGLTLQSAHEDDDPLAMSPLGPTTRRGTRMDRTSPSTPRYPASTPSGAGTAKERNASASRVDRSKDLRAEAREVQRAGDKLIWGGRKDLVAPSDEDEFEEWANVRARENTAAMAKGKEREINGDDGMNPILDTTHRIPLVCAVKPYL